MEWWYSTYWYLIYIYCSTFHKLVARAKTLKGTRISASIQQAFGDICYVPGTVRRCEQNQINETRSLFTKVRVSWRSSLVVIYFGTNCNSGWVCWVSRVGTEKKGLCPWHQGYVYRANCCRCLRQLVPNLIETFSANGELLKILSKPYYTISSMSWTKNLVFLRWRNDLDSLGIDMCARGKWPSFGIAGCS